MPETELTEDVTCPREMVTVTLQMAGPDWELRTTMSVPAGPTRLGELLPLVHSFALGRGHLAGIDTLPDGIVHFPAQLFFFRFIYFVGLLRFFIKGIVVGM